MRVLVLGGDGYIGWPLAQHLAMQGHNVFIIDNGIRRKRVAECGGMSLVPILSLPDRVSLANDAGLSINYEKGDVESVGCIEKIIYGFKPDAMVHLAQQPSAPLSMLSVEHAINTQVNNLTSTVRLLFALRDAAPHCHIVKLGTMGQYGYGTLDNLPLGEGSLSVSIGGNNVQIPMPKYPGSFYHASKVHDSVNIEMACRLWGMRATELNQGIVYGHSKGISSDEKNSSTRLDYDFVHGTVLNRFCVQAAIGMPLTIYGQGGQVRGVIALNDALECIRLVIESPPNQGEFRTFNQMTESLSVQDIGIIVKEAAEHIGLSVASINIKNPRIEKENHSYQPIFEGLRKLGLQPKFLTKDVAASIIELGLRWPERIIKDAILP